MIAKYNISLFDVASYWCFTRTDDNLSDFNNVPARRTIISLMEQSLNSMVSTTVKTYNKKHKHHRIYFVSIDYETLIGLFIHATKVKYFFF